MAGRCYTELHKPAKAEPLLRNAIEQYNQALVRENALYLSWLAEDYVQLGDLDQAADISMRITALAAHTNSVRTDARLRHVAKQLSPYRSTPSVADFFDAYASSAETS